MTWFVSLVFCSRVIEHHLLYHIHASHEFITVNYFGLHFSLFWFFFSLFKIFAAHHVEMSFPSCLSLCTSTRPWYLSKSAETLYYTHILFLLHFFHSKSHWIPTTQWSKYQEWTNLLIPMLP